jgi:HlyD family secretion protein
MTKTKLALIVTGGLLGVFVMIGVAAPDEAYPDVRTEPVAPRDLYASVIGNGVLQPRKRLEITSDLAGRVTELNVREGSVVRKGQVLLRIEQARYEIAVAKAAAQLSQTLASVEQVRANLLQSQTGKRRAEEIEQSTGLLAGLELEQARTQAASSEAQFKAANHTVEQATAALADARDQLERTVNNPEAALLVVSDLSAMEARIVVDETDLPHIHLGDSVSIRVDAFPKMKFSGRVARIASSALRSANGGQTSNNFQVFVAVDSSETALHADFSVSAEIITEARLGALSVPILSLVVRDNRGHRVQRGGVEGVFLVEDGVARFRPVRVGIVGEQYAEVTAGLKPGARVVSGTYQLIRELETGVEVGKP